MSPVRAIWKVSPAVIMNSVMMEKEGIEPPPPFWLELMEDIMVLTVIDTRFRMIRKKLFDWINYITCFDALIVIMFLLQSVRMQRASWMWEPGPVDGWW